jgi:hypothetical protein
VERPAALTNNTTMIFSGGIHSVFRASLTLPLFCLLLLPHHGFGQLQNLNEDQPLPETDAFLSKVKENLRSDRLLLSDYTYNMQSNTRYLDKDGHINKTEIREYEVYPSIEEDMTYQRLIAENGIPISPGKIEEQDREYAKKAGARTRRLAKDSRSDKEERLAKEAKENEKERATIEDLFQLYKFELVSREMVGDHSAIVIKFTPKPQYQPRTKDGGLLKKFRGWALTSETDYQVIRVDAELIDDISIGLGLLARVHKGTRLSFIRQKINNEIWLPAEFHFIASARAFLFKRLRIESTTLFSDHKKYSVSSIYEVLPQKPFQ